MINGLDLSHWDGTVVWDDVPDDYKFVFIKATEGGYRPDPLADQHYIGAQGRLRGFYHFWRYGVPASKQIAEFRSVTAAIEARGGKAELPPVIDLEDFRAPKSSVIIPHIRATLANAELAFGRKPIIYTARWWTDEWIGDCSWLKEYPLWVADYTAVPPAQPNRMPKGLTNWVFWQWTDKAEIPGIAENNEDRDVFFGSLERLYAFCGIGPVASLDERVERLEAQMTNVIAAGQAAEARIASLEARVAALEGA
jgi:lysozyme